VKRPVILILHSFLPDGVVARWQAEFSECEFVDGRQPEVGERRLKDAVIAYGVPPIARLGEAPSLQWIQLLSAGVPAALCPEAANRNILVTNLAGLYGPTIAEHALAMMLILSRNLQMAVRNQQERRWDRGVANTMADLHGKTSAVIGLGNIGQNIARLAKACGMRVLGVRRRLRYTPYVDRLYSREELHEMLPEADYVAVAAPLTKHTEGMLGPAEFQAMKRGVRYVNVSRGPIAQESALVAALQSGHVAAAGLDVFAVEPLAAEHPLWSMPQVIISPHYSGETVNNSALPAERFTRNLRAWLSGRDLEAVVDLECGY
jgi:phosphoglycerate dehydrogenase-like enzyme